MLWAGPDAVVAVETSPPGSRHTDEEAALAVLDLRTKARRPLCDVAGIRPITFSVSGARCLAKTHARGLFVGSLT